MIGVSKGTWLPVCFLALGSLDSREANCHVMRHPDTQERSYGEELRPLANSQVMSYLESGPSGPSQAFGWPQPCHHLNCHLMRNPDSWQGHYGLRNPASELTVPSHGPRTHPSGVETGCAAFSVTRNSIRRQWTRSEDTTKQKKTLGLKERDAPREAWGSHSVCPAGNHHAGAILAWGQTTRLHTDRQTWQWLRDCPVQWLGFVEDAGA